MDLSQFIEAIVARARGAVLSTDGWVQGRLFGLSAGAETQCAESLEMKIQTEPALIALCLALIDPAERLTAPEREWFRTATGDERTCGVDAIRALIREAGIRLRAVLSDSLGSSTTYQRRCVHPAVHR